MRTMGIYILELTELVEVILNVNDKPHTVHAVLRRT
jgi:hypothetical protein